MLELSASIAHEFYHSPKRCSNLTVVVSFKFVYSQIAGKIMVYRLIEIYHMQHTLKRKNHAFNHMHFKTQF